MAEKNPAMHEALGNLRKQLRDRTAKHKLFTITVEHHEPGAEGEEKEPEPAAHGAHLGESLLSPEDGEMEATPHKRR